MASPRRLERAMRIHSAPEAKPERQASCVAFSEYGRVGSSYNVRACTNNCAADMLYPHHKDPVHPAQESQPIAEDQHAMQQSLEGLTALDMEGEFVVRDQCGG